MRPRFEWNIGRRALPLGQRTLVMGVLNVTPDSFSDGGSYSDPQAAVAHGLALLDQGADILDIGGESTRPGAPTDTPQAPALPGAVSAQQEIDRVLPVIEAIKRQRPAAILSIDTYKSSVALAALHAGAEIVNDVSGFTWDPNMAATLAARPCGAVLMHVRGLPHQWRTLPPLTNVVSLVRQQLQQHLSHALAAGIPPQSIVLDPGFGFGKNFDENYSLLAGLANLHLLGFPLLVGVSRKGFLRHAVAARLSELGCPTFASRSSTLRWETAPSPPHSAADPNPPQSADAASPEADPHPPQSADAASPEGGPHPPQSADAASPEGCPHPPSFGECGGQDTPPLDTATIDSATLAASVAAALAGAHIVRVHAVRSTIEALAIADAILALQPASREPTT